MFRGHVGEISDAFARCGYLPSLWLEIHYEACAAIRVRREASPCLPLSSPSPGEMQYKDGMMKLKLESMGEIQMVALVISGITVMVGIEAG